MFIMVSQIVTFADSWKTQKFKHLENKASTRKLINCTFKGYIMAKKQFFNEDSQNSFLRKFFINKTNYQLLREVFLYLLNTSQTLENASAC